MMSTVNKPSIPRILPFAVFMAFIGIEELIRFLANQKLMVIAPTNLLIIYPIKVIITACVLINYRHTYTEIKWRELKTISNAAIPTLTGLLVFILWINMDWSWATLGTLKGYDPTMVSDKITRNLLLFSRIIGASFIVPIMEELFWRSWLLRYLIDQDFDTVRIGTFTWASFTISSIMFGLEHNLWLAGVMAGIAYTCLLYYTRSLAACILAHSITNGLLAGYVLLSGRWEFW